MLPLAHTGLTPPAVAGPGCNEWLGLTAGSAGKLKAGQLPKKTECLRKARLADGTGPEIGFAGERVLELPTNGLSVGNLEKTLESGLGFAAKSIYALSCCEDGRRCEVKVTVQDANIYDSRKHVAAPKLVAGRKEIASILANARRTAL
jgi:hypothetical protein